jgi:hypothetical protein
MTTASRRDAAHNPGAYGHSGVPSRINPVTALVLSLALSATDPVGAALATPEQKLVCTPDVDRLQMSR